MTIQVGLTLPSFVEDPDIPIAVARAAEEAGLDAVFVYDHLWRGHPPKRRPALECFALLGAVAAETTRIQLPQADLGDVFLAATASVFDLTLVTADSQLTSCSWLKTLAND